MNSQGTLPDASPLHPPNRTWPCQLGRGIAGGTSSETLRCQNWQIQREELSSLGTLRASEEKRKSLEASQSSPHTRGRFGWRVTPSASLQGDSAFLATGSGCLGRLVHHSSASASVAPGWTHTADEERKPKQRKLLEFLKAGQSHRSLRCLQLLSSFQSMGKVLVIDLLFSLSQYNIFIFSLPFFLLFLSKGNK